MVFIVVSEGIKDKSGEFLLSGTSVNDNFGHAGNGNIHVYLLVDPDNTEEMDRAEKCLNEIFDLVISLNGTLSGEHGIGREKRAYIDREIDATTMNLMNSIKQVFDPNNILNPGKLFL